MAQQFSTYTSSRLRGKFDVVRKHMELWGAKCLVEQQPKTATDNADDEKESDRVMSKNKVTQRKTAWFSFSSPLRSNGRAFVQYLSPSYLRWGPACRLVDSLCPSDRIQSVSFDVGSWWKLFAGLFSYFSERWKPNSSRFTFSTIEGKLKGN